MLHNDRESLELDRLEYESLLAEEKKLRWEANLYPVAVFGGVLTAFTAVAGFFFKF